MSDTKEVNVSGNIVKKSNAMNIQDIKIPEILDLKEVVSERQNKRNAYLEQIAQHLVYDVPTRSVKGGAFDTVTRVEYHSIDDDEWHEIEIGRAKIFDAARMQAMSMDDFKKNGLPVPKNFISLSNDYYTYQDKFNDIILEKFLHLKREDVKLCDQRFIQDICEAFELKHRIGLVNFQVAQSSGGNTSSIM
jgi:hypothetical protein